MGGKKKRRKNPGALETSANQEIHVEQEKPVTQPTQDVSCTQEKNKRQTETVGAEAMLPNALTQVNSHNTRRSPTKDNVKEHLIGSEIRDDGPKESSSADDTSKNNKMLVESVAHCAIPKKKQTREDARAKRDGLLSSTNRDKGKITHPQKVSSCETKNTAGSTIKVRDETKETVTSVPVRLQDLTLEESSASHDGTTSPHTKKDTPIGRLSLQGEAKIFAAVIVVGTNVLQAVFQTIYFHKEIKCQEDNPVVPLRKWFEKYEFSNKKIKDRLGGQYSNNNSDPLSTKYDIQFYTFVLDFYCKKYSNLLEGLIDDINKVKEMRDKLCHKGLLYTCEKATLNTLEKAYVNSLKRVGNRCNNKTYTQPLLKTVPKSMAHIKKKDQKLDTFQKIKDKFMNGLRPKFISMAQEELSKTVKRDFTNPFYWIHENTNFVFPLDKVFCDPWLEGICQPGRVDAAKLLLYPESGVPQRVVILVGDGATGKTTLCHTMLWQWQQKHEKEPTFLRLKHFDLVLLIELRNTTEIALVQYLKHTLLTETMKKIIHTDDLLELLRDLDVLYIIDGFDEQDGGGRNVKLVKDIAKNVSTKNRVILTTRCEYQIDAQKLFTPVGHDSLLLKGLDRKEQLKLSMNLIDELRKGENCKELHEQFGNFLKKRGNVFLDRLRIPLIMNLLVSLCLEAKDTYNFLNEIKSATQLYRELVKMLKDKLAERLGKAATREVSSDDVSGLEQQDETGSSKDAFPTQPTYSDPFAIKRSLDEMLPALSEVAFSQTRAPTFDLKLNSDNLSHLIDLCSKKQIKCKQFFSAFLILDLEARVHQYSFFHRTEADYFSAFFITEEVKKSVSYDLVSYFSSENEMRKYQEMILFLVGCFSIDNKLNRVSSDVIKIVSLVGVDRYDFNFMFKLLVESCSGKDHSLECRSCKEPFCSKIADYLHPRLWTLKHDTTIAGLTILKHCQHVEISDLEIDFAPQVDPDSNENLVELSDLMEKLKWDLKPRFCKGNRNEIELSLHLRYHALENCTSTSDRYLSHLHPWAKLVNFTGHIGLEASRHLFYCTNLKDLDIRITSVEAYNEFMKTCFSRYSRLKKIILRLCFPPGTVDVPSLLPFPDLRQKSLRTAVRLHFRDVLKSSLDEMMSIILKISAGQDNVFERVVINSSDLDLASAKSIFQQLQAIVCEKVSVSSHNELREGQLGDILGMPSSFIFEWNNRNISEALWAGPNPTVVYRGPMTRPR